jgi:hypothetical protein
MILLVIAFALYAEVGCCVNFVVITGLRQTVHRKKLESLE